MRADISESVERGTNAVRDPLSRDNRPLVVDVDELLIASDGIAGSGNSKPTGGFPAIAESLAGLLGLEGLRSRIRDSYHFSQAEAVFHPGVMTFLLKAVGEGRPVYLCSELHSEQLVRSLAEHLGVFVAWSADVRKHPLADSAELPAGLQHGFDYLGSRAADLPECVAK